MQLCLETSPQEGCAPRLQKYLHRCRQKLCPQSTQTPLMCSSSASIHLACAPAGLWGVGTARHGSGRDGAALLGPTGAGVEVERRRLRRGGKGRGGGGSGGAGGGRASGEASAAGMEHHQPASRYQVVSAGARVVLFNRWVFSSPVLSAVRG